ncbi:bifunctional diaminohydroxyphosphoribosylaminopyrimidine deaminase/5-amino-6-(5-phosphoribosylamino)uracil reductase RibD [Arenicella sp. 4NH20-0111]|uniref:bifunctional diaminohydroxyphosphoribosylaminopyrimidine deaminase/5-amino-6-(5-phosphoribosylamino)uracil reductase RibD n=1 Tax=Arenicella sp. 4NH20-0111 TaxID=3127648 RepID=UPI00310A57D6
MNDKAMMHTVLELAAQGAHTTQPNPRVGCIIVNDGEIVGQGYHHQAGELHAERLALAEAGDRARGATAYVNLEPCCHQGRTPPCTDGLIDAGVTKVVASMRDPNPRVSGSGFELLKGAGIEVVNGVLNEQAIWLNRGFVSRMANEKPWVILKSAATLDGRTAAFDGKSKWITGEQARTEVQTVRAGCSAILTGIGTVLADDPSLNVRIGGDTARQPLRVILDSNLQTPIDAKIIGVDQKLVIFTLSDDLEKMSALIELGAEVVQLKNTNDGRLELSSVLDELAKWQCNEVLIEAGQTLSGAFLQQGLVDELVLFYAGSLLGDQGKSMFQFDQPLEFEQRANFKISSVSMVGEDVKVTAVNTDSVDSLTHPKSIN